MKVILLGPPGAGKGTQARRLQAVLHAPHIASGDILRAIRRQKSDLAREVKPYMDAGGYVPDHLMNKLVLTRLNEPDAAHGFLLDGYPRTEPQAEELDRSLARKGQHLDAAILISVPPEILVQRIAGRIICPQCHSIYNADTKRPRVDGVCDVCGHELERRTDEAPEVLRTRLETYIQQTTPLADYYRAQGLLHEVDGSLPLEEVTMTIDRALGIKEGTGTL